MQMKSAHSKLQQQHICILQGLEQRHLIISLNDMQLAETVSSEQCITQIYSEHPMYVGTLQPIQ